MLPNMEQQSIFNAWNFSFSFVDQGGAFTVNTTVGYTQITTLLCPSDGASGRPNPPWGSLNYVGNNGGPGVVQSFSGTIISPNWGDNVSAPSTGAVGIEAITDGSSNTALFSERLMGLAGSPVVYPGKTSQSKRGTFPIATSAVVNSGNSASALLVLQACQALPSTTPSGSSLTTGWAWVIAYPWYPAANRYFHFGPPNSISCDNPSTSFGYPWGGGGGIISATSNHSGGVNVCFSDGSVKFIKDSISTQAWWALGTRNMGEVISSDAY